MVVTFNFPNGLPNITNLQSEPYKRLLIKFKEKMIVIPDIHVLVGAKIMINSFYELFELDQEEALIWDEAFFADAYNYCTIISVGIHKQHLELFLDRYK
jgi:hypothetical protein